MLKATEDIVVAGEASTVREAIEEAQRTRPDVVVIDIRLAEGSEIEATRGIKSRRSCIPKCASERTLQEVEATAGGASSESRKPPAAHATGLMD